MNAKRMPDGVATLPGVAMGTRQLFACCMLTMFLPGAVLAADGEVIGARLYATCASCHGTAGTGAGTALPPLAGQPRSALVASMNGFRDGSRPATIMHQIAKGYTPEQIEEIAAFLERQKP